MNKEIITPIVRHSATVFGAYLVQAGYISNAEMELGVGIAVMVFSLAWSIAERRWARKTITKLENEKKTDE